MEEDNDMVTMTGSTIATVDALAVAIQREHKAASDAAMAALDHALEAGRLLAEARAAIPHGGWEAFVRDRCGIAPRTARLYLQLDANRDRIANRQRVAGLSVREAARLVAKPKQISDLRVPEWYRPGHDHFGTHPSGWLFEVSPHPSGEPWVHCTVFSGRDYAAVPTDRTAFGAKRGIRIDLVEKFIGLMVEEGMPSLDDPRWEIESSLVDAAAVAAEPRYNHWLFTREEYREHCLGLVGSP